MQMTKAKFSDFRWTAGLVGPARLCSISLGYAEVPRRFCLPSLQIGIVAGVEVEDATLDRFELKDSNWTANRQGVYQASTYVEITAMGSIDCPGRNKEERARRLALLAGDWDNSVTLESESK